TAPTAPASQPSAAAPPVATTASAPGASTASVSGANAATAPGASAAAARANTASTAGAPAAAPPPSAWYRDKLGDGLVIGGIVAATIGLLEYRGALSDLNAAENRSTTTTLARYDDLLASAHDKRTASVVLFGASAALVAGGITRFILRDRGGEVRSVSVAPARRGAVRSVSVAPARGGAVISVGGSL
ncbi:MAG TPA: hypothetical protein VIX73_11080, partial [Kofleriaceae bacterium]